MNKIILIIVIVILVGIGGYFLLRGGYQAPVSAPTPAPGVAPGAVEEKIVSEGTPEVTEPEGITPPPTIPEVKELTVLGTEYSFSPSSINVKAKDQVKITFQNIGRVNHNFIVEGLGISTKTISAGKSDTIEFTVPTSGTYIIFCSVPGHRAAGMVGSLEVE